MIQMDPEDRPTATRIIRKLEKAFEQVKKGKRMETQIGKLEVKRGSISSRDCYEPQNSGFVWHCLFHPFEAKLACALDKGRICIFSASNISTPFQQWDTVISKATTNEKVWRLDWNIDGSKLAAGCKDGTLVVWEVGGSKSFEIKKHSDCIRCIRWNKAVESSHLLITGSDDHIVVVWDSRQQSVAETFRLHSKSINDITWISADVFASCSEDKTIQICHIGQPTAVRTYHHDDAVRSVRWMELDQRLVSCSDDGSIKIWSLDSSEPITTLRGDGSAICHFDCYRICKNDDPCWWIAGGCWYFSFYLWHLKPNGAVISTRKLEDHPGSIASVAFSPDGRSVASLDRDGKLIIWSTQNGAVIFKTETNASGYDLSWLSSGNKLAVTDWTNLAHVIEFET